MSSLIPEPNGRRRIEVIIHGKRRRIRLGKMDHKTAEAIQTRVDELARAAEVGSRDPDAEKWCDRLSDSLRAKLSVIGLLTARQSETLQGLVDRAKKSRDHVKVSTQAADKQAYDSLLEEFGSGKNLRTITPIAAQEWRESLVKDGLAAATIAKRVIRARALFAQAVRWELVDANPFDDVRAGSQTNPSRIRFIDATVSAAVLAACPNAEWRGIFSLSRWGGVRMPSEIVNLRWSDVLWDKDRFRVMSPKTEHHDGKQERWVPLFPEVRTALMDLFNAAPDGAEFVFDRKWRTAANLRTHMTRIIGKAGHSPWPRLFHNLRASRQTELSQTFPLYIVCRWLGNSEKVADQHYLSVLESSFSKAAQNAAQPTPDMAGLDGPATEGDALNTLKNDVLSGGGGFSNQIHWAVQGSNTLRLSIENLLIRNGCGAKSGALADEIVGFLIRATK
jgi:integrase